MFKMSDVRTEINHYRMINYYTHNYHC